MAKIEHYNHITPVESLVARDLIGIDRNIILGGRLYLMPPPTISRLAGVTWELRDFINLGSLTTCLSSTKNVYKIVAAVSRLMTGEAKWTEALSHCSVPELSRILSCALGYVSISDYDEILDVCVRQGNNDNTTIVGGKTIFGQIASFIELLHLSYHEVVYEVPYRSLLIMSKDKQRIEHGVIMREVSEEEYFRDKGRNPLKE